jgi:hypothetical protein
VVAKPDEGGAADRHVRLFGTSSEGTTKRPANHSAASASVEGESELVAQPGSRASSNPVVRSVVPETLPLPGR